jgi:hypothetical protein
MAMAMKVPIKVVCPDCGHAFDRDASGAAVHKAFGAAAPFRPRADGGGGGGCGTRHVHTLQTSRRIGDTDEDGSTENGEPSQCAFHVTMMQQQCTCRLCVLTENRMTSRVHQLVERFVTLLQCLCMAMQLFTTASGSFGEIFGQFNATTCLFLSRMYRVALIASTAKA